MERREWLDERRAAGRDGYTRDAPTYEDGYDPVTEVHRRFVAALVDHTPAGGAILDAACGTAPYAGMVLETGRSVVGVDQSAGMLARAGEKHPEVRFERIGLQEISFDAAFDAAMVVDAMEHVPPEDWPTVLANLRRALTDSGHLYLTVELVDDPRLLDRALGEAVAAGLPAVHGEYITEATGGYHFYPTDELVDGWLRVAGFTIVDEAEEWLDGYGYRHLLTRVAPAAGTSASRPSP